MKDMIVIGIIFACALYIEFKGVSYVIARLAEISNKLFWGV